MSSPQVRTGKKSYWRPAMLVLFVLAHCALLGVAGFMYFVARMALVVGEGDGSSVHVRAAPTFRSTIEHSLFKLILWGAVYSIFAPMFRRKFDFVSIGGSAVIVASMVALITLDATSSDTSPAWLTGVALFGVALLAYSPLFAGALFLAVESNRGKNVGNRGARRLPGGIAGSR